MSHDRYAAHSEPALAENPVNSNDLIAGSKMFTAPKQYQFKVGTYYSKDGGRTWHDSGYLPGFQQFSIVSDVSIAFSADGVAYVAVLAWDGQNRSGIFVSRSTDGGKTFSDPVAVVLDTTGVTFNDKPWIAVDQTSGPYRGTVYVVWNLDGPTDVDRGEPDAVLHPRALTAPGAGMAVARSTDGGRTFSTPTIVAPFDHQHFYIGALPAVAPNGTLYIPFTSFDVTNSIDGIAMVTSSDGGKTFSGSTLVQSNVVPVPNHLRHSTFRNITFPMFAISPKDSSMVMVWSDYRHGDADVMSSTSRDGGRTWSRPTRVNHDPAGNGKDQFMPVIAVSKNGIYTCAWFDRRYDPKDRLIDEVVSQSRDDGQSYGAAIRVTNHSWDPAIDAPEPEGKATNTFIGDYQALAVDNHTVHPLWNDTQNHVSQEIRTATVATQLFSRH